MFVGQKLKLHFKEFKKKKKIKYGSEHTFILKWNVSIVQLNIFSVAPTN